MAIQLCCIKSIINPLMGMIIHSSVKMVLPPSLKRIYGKCLKISYAKVSNKIAYVNSADPAQTASDGGAV